MITREEYLNALEVIDNYHRQSERVRIAKLFTEKRIDCSARLFNTLMDNFTYMDEVNEVALSKCRNVGNKTVQEFRELIKTL